jgi:UDP-N-acetylglucosamine 4,6-dehydratase/5-epimerase
MFKDRVILITGGTGSFGHAFLERLLESKEEYKEIRIFSRDELKQEHMRVQLANPKLKFYLGDVRDRDSVDYSMQGVDYVFHAAALKQVPSCEFFPIQAVMTNVLGSHNVVESCIAHGVKKVVMLGTDKAVYPVNTMGMTKALMEKVGQAAARTADASKTVICSVRYGNVMSSRGSVIPLFIQQIKSNLPITVTEPEMTRFLLRLEDAIDLVLFAFESGEAGDVLIKKAPASTIGDLAEAVRNLFGSTVPIRTIGIRHGEKMWESLASREELKRGTDHGDYLRIRLDDRDLNYGKYFTDGYQNVSIDQDYSSDNAQRLKVREIEELLLRVSDVHRELVSAGAIATEKPLSSHA